RTTHVAEVSVARTTTLSIFRRCFMAIDGWLGQKAGQLTCRWSALLMFLTLAILGAIWYWTGSLPQNILVLHDNWYEGGAVFVLSGPSRLADIALIPAWVAFFVYVFLSASKDPGATKAVVITILISSLFGLLLVLVTSGDIIWMGMVFILVVGLVASLFSFAQGLVFRGEIEDQTKEKKLDGDGFPSFLAVVWLLISMSFVLPCWFIYGSVSATVLALTTSLIGCLVSLISYSLGFYGWVSGRAVFRYLTGQDIKEDSSAVNQ
ncbi:hypothetical protein KKC47_02425, partial [Patescibacteria group bacterium]|nr:hypothetical protein [Patescibacteria group bacterium]